jgi:hypothetical protein
MKSYPSIQHHGEDLYGRRVLAFDKLDGSNIRFEYSRKRGWYKFGSISELIHEKTPIYGEAVTIFLDKYGDDLARIFRKEYPTIQNFVAFGEFVGENSFAGKHLENDVKDLVMFDISLYKKGFLAPREFVDKFSKLHIPELIYDGIYDDDFINSIKSSTSLKEGVICKGISKTKRDGETIWMSKIKTDDWLVRVREKFGIFAIKEEFNGKIPLIYS